MDRTFEGRCSERACDHSAADHVVTPELASHGESSVVWCHGCRRHEVTRASRWLFRARSHRLSRPSAA